MMQNEDLAYFYKNSLKSLKKDVAVYVEGIDDVDFWRDIFLKFAPDLKLEFYYFIDEKGTSGIDKVLEFKEFTDNSFVIAIDSEYKWLFQDKIFDNQHFIFQTYTHSIENHKCQAEILNRILIKVNQTQNFDFEVFMKKLSEILFPILLHLIVCKQKDDKKALDFVFNQIKAILPIESKLSIDSQGSSILENYRFKVQTFFQNFKTLFGEIDLISAQQYLQDEFQITPQDTVWFLKGHLIYSIAIVLLDKLTLSAHNQQKAEFYAKFDVKTAKFKTQEFKNYQQKQNFQALIFNGHLISLAEGNLNPFLQKIQSDIQNFIKNENKNI
jgi:hypothetical protein